MDSPLYNINIEVSLDDEVVRHVSFSVRSDDQAHLMDRVGERLLEMSPDKMVDGDAYIKAMNGSTEDMRAYTEALGPPEGWDEAGNRTS